MFVVADNQAGSQGGRRQVGKLPRFKVCPLQKGQLVSNSGMSAAKGAACVQVGYCERGSKLSANRVA